MPAHVRVAASRATRAVNLLRAIQFTHPPSCPCHSNPGHPHGHGVAAAAAARRQFATPVDALQKEYAFEMAASSIRFGPGVTKEVGMDLTNLGAKRVILVTDQTVLKLNAVKQAVEGLEREGIQYDIFSNVRVEPKDSS